VAAHFEQAERLTTFHDDVGDLIRVLGRLRWRLGLERILVFGIRGLSGSAIVLIGLLVTTWLLPLASWAELAWIVALPLVASVCMALLRWPSNRQAALAADRRLALEERLGTAVEISARFNGRLDRLQVRDAVARAQAAPSAWLVVDRTIRREALLASALSALAAVSLMLPGLPRPGLPIADPSAAMSDAVSPAAALDRTDPAMAELTFIDTQPMLPTDAGLANRVQQQQAEREALDSLAQAIGRISAGQVAADAIQRGDFAAARDQLATLGEEADQLSEAAKQQLSRALQQAANATANTDRPLADRERQAAQALSRNTYGDQRQALRNLADQVARSGARTASADQLARDVGRLQQQASAASAGATDAADQTQGARSQAPGAQGRAPGNAANAAQAGAAAAGGQAGAGAGQQGGPGFGTGANPDVFGDQSSQLDTSGQRVEVPIKLGAGSGVRPPDGTEDQTGTDPSLPAHNVSELVQFQQTGQVAPEQNLVPGEQRPVVRGYFR
jgi:hypothetical protein